MDNNFQFGSKKILIIIGVMFLFLFLIIIKAFDYLPQESTSTSENEKNQVLITNNAKDVYSDTSEEETVDKSKASSKFLNIKLPNPDADIVDIKPIEEEIKVVEPEPVVTDEASKNLTPQEETELRFFKAKQYKESKQYVKAIEEYSSLAESLKEISLQARCYEEIAGIYGIMKRYGTALSYAQRAYNLSPSSSREMQLARLYYKTGDIDKATSRINNILQRDFVYDK